VTKKHVKVLTLLDGSTFKLFDFKLPHIQSVDYKTNCNPYELPTTHKQEMEMNFKICQILNADFKLAAL
jgi:hypothetical protein